MIDYLDMLQKLNNILFELLGECGITINIQVYINKERHELDLPDKNEMINGYVQ